VIVKRHCKEFLTSLTPGLVRRGGVGQITIWRLQSKPAYVHRTPTSPGCGPTAMLVDKKKRLEFTWAETLNDCADNQATEARETRSTPELSHWPEQQISIEGPRGRISGRLDHEIRYSCTSTDLLSYCQQCFHWTKTQVQSVDLEGTRAASKKVRPDMARRIQKLRCGWLPVNTREAQSDPDRVSGCSACSIANLVPETVDHVFQCTAPARQTILLERFSSFAVHFRSMKTSISLIGALHSGALAWAEQREPRPVENLDLPDNRLGQLIWQAYAEQTSL
jgi:hypothetical protein